MEQYECTVCGYIYNEKDGEEEGEITPGTTWQAVPASWVCPLCAEPKSSFVKCNNTL
ncbi:MAG: rubredoxin [Treponema sp.]|nr:rubredoxin [Treponema sp.]